MDADVSAVEQFVQQGLANQLSSAMRRSQPSLPSPHSRITRRKRPKPASEYVTTIVGNNFKENVYGDNRDALVVVLAPFGPPNYQVEDALDDYGETVYSKSDGLRQKLKLLKIDGTQNDVQQFTGFEIVKSVGNDLGCIWLHKFHMKIILCISTSTYFLRYPSLFYVRRSKSDIPIPYSCPPTVEAISMLVDRAMDDELIQPMQKQLWLIYDIGICNNIATIAR